METSKYPKRRPGDFYSGMSDKYDKVKGEVGIHHLYRIMEVRGTKTSFAGELAAILGPTTLGLSKSAPSTPVTPKQKTPTEVSAASTTLVPLPQQGIAETATTKTTPEVMKK